MKYQFVAAVVALAMASASAAPYTIVDLGVIADNTSFGFALNDAGWAVGAYRGPSTGASTFEFNPHGFVYDGTSYTDILTLDPTDARLSSSAFDINNNNETVGFSLVQSLEGTATTFRSHPVSFVGATLTDLGLAPDMVGGKALGINDAGLVVGYEEVVTTSIQFTAKKAIIIDRALSDPYLVVGTKKADGSGSSVFRSINENGVAVGWSLYDGGLGGHAMYFDLAASGGLANLADGLVDIGTLGGVVSDASDINNNGVIVGRAQNTGSIDFEAFKYVIGQSTAPEPLGVLNAGEPRSQAYAINDSGQTVGFSVFEKLKLADRNHAVLFENDKVVDLNDQIDCALGWTLLEARDINASGQIIGTGLLNDTPHAFLLTPDANGGAGAVCATPDPGLLPDNGGGSFGLWSFLLLTLGLFHRRRRF